jgi:hypothetical protein
MKLSALFLTAMLLLANHVWAATGEQPEPAPVREYARVVFVNPVKVGDRVLVGAYLIEHDHERMARGRPCTYIYKANDVRLPVVAFRCRHLHRTPGPASIITLRRLPDMTGNGSELLEFQFARSAEGHGVPGAR